MDITIRRVLIYRHKIIKYAFYVATFFAALTLLFYSISSFDFLPLFDLETSFTDIIKVYITYIGSLIGITSLLYKHLDTLNSRNKRYKINKEAIYGLLYAIISLVVGLFFLWIANVFFHRYQIELDLISKLLYYFYITFFVIIFSLGVIITVKSFKVILTDFENNIFKNK